MTGKELVVDAYCGSGTIGLWLAPDAREVRGIEVIAEAVEDARRNADASGMGNCRFYVGQSEALLPDWIKRGERPDVIVVDPPRTGCDRKLLSAVIAAKPRRFVYVSCNPSTCQGLPGAAGRGLHPRMGAARRYVSTDFACGMLRSVGQKLTHRLIL